MTDPPRFHRSPHGGDAALWSPDAIDDLLRAERLACPPDIDVRTEELLVVVVGAHLRAEIADRPLAQRLVRLIRAWQAVHLDDGDLPLVPVVATDVWFLNDADLMRQPCISIGEPGHNAATAHYASRLPTSYVVEKVCTVQFDPQFLDGSVCLWGADVRGTEAAFTAFVERHLDAYLRAVHFLA
jgi:hypothetical protein